MKRISRERKAATLAKLLPPYSMTVAAASQMEGIPEATLYNWRNQAKAEGKPVPGSNQKNSGQWPARHSPQRIVLFNPVFKYQTRHPFKLPHIIDHQHSAGGDGVPDNRRIVRADWLANYMGSRET
jgi:hypothetical protein